MDSQGLDCHRCGPILDIAAYGSVISVAIIEVILMLRLWAMYARNRLFGIFLVCVFVVGIGIALAIRKVEPPDNFKLVREAPQILTICKRSSPSELFFLYAIILVVETMTFGLLLLKVWQLSAVGVAPILKTMLKHGTQYYLVVFAALLLQVLGTVLQPLWQPMADSLPVVTIASISCSRLVLSLRGINAAPREATTIQDFQARPNYETQPVPLSVFRASRGSKAFVGTSTSTTSNTNTTEYERGTMHYGTYRDSYHPPIHEEDEDGDEMERSTSKDDDIGSPPRHPLGSSDNSHWRSGGHAI
ncbi:hypothetical protein FRB91_006509 [Serendipita sp. 411]|nr:hypothetical protein FRC19_002937 [Serendipita sp. 401]KAG8831365.1 hypothetical protein FRC18_006674 [Serendipita sp. 400]KAG8852440.1 hypothetical protein FRB91_006509 [Serendipita sp. 411]